METRNETREDVPWGSLEELLLVCAVNRHGTNSWDSIVVEVQNRTPNLPLLTSQHCIDKFNDLKRRFLAQNGAASTDLVPIIDELRRIRVEELKRDVQRRDLSIMSLEMKVKKLEEEREKSLKAEADLREKKSSPETIADKSTGAEGLNDDLSFNESNSTSQQKTETTEAKEQNDAKERGLGSKPDPKTKVEEPDPDDKNNDNSGQDMERYWSHNGRLTEDMKEPTENKDVKITKPSGLGELGESVGESNREEKEKQNSDVQSSASLSVKKGKRRRRRGNMKGGGGGGGGGGGEGGDVLSSSGEEQEGGDEVSPAKKRVSSTVKSEPLIKFLKIVRSHRHGSLFERRHRSQESERYRSLIRQHMDLQTIQSRLDNGAYADNIQRFFRDLLLIFTNAIIFNRKNSPECAAARELRALVLKEISEKLRKPKPAHQPKPEPIQNSGSFSKTKKSSSTMVVCGRRNSMKSGSETNGRKGDNKKDKESEEKPTAKEKKVEAPFVKLEEKGIRKKRTGERSASGPRNNRKTSNKNGETEEHHYGGNELSSHDGLESKLDKNENPVKKKQGAASFLRRMNQKSPSELTEDSDDSSDEEEESKDDSAPEKEGKKPRGNSKEVKKERVQRNTRSRSVKEESAKGKRGVGRPMKKQATANDVEPSGGRGKRARGNEVGVGGAARARKRSRR